MTRGSNASIHERDVAYSGCEGAIALREPNRKQVLAQRSIIVPPLKWAGGKRWLVASHRDIFPSSYERYFEPFVGSAAVFFALRPQVAFLSDTNSELIDFYCALRSRPDLVRRYLVVHGKNHDSSYYYQLRGSVGYSQTARAARFLYLNRVCWNGLYRVNRKGEFNVPIGTKTQVLFDFDDFESVATALSCATLLNADFAEVIERSRAGDFVFCDPPYTVKHNYNGFVKYNEKIFSWADQVRLASSVRAASARGVKILVTNAYHESIKDLYAGFAIQKLTRPSVISGSNKGRGEFEECVITNYDNCLGSN